MNLKKPETENSKKEKLNLKKTQNKIPNKLFKTNWRERNINKSFSTKIK